MSVAATDATQLARVFHALSDPTRLGIVERLREGERCVCELMDDLDAAQSRLSFHLKVLRDAGVVDCRREGRWAYYWLRPDTLGDLNEATRALVSSRGVRAAVRGQCCT